MTNKGLQQGEGGEHHVTVGYVDANAWLDPITTGMMKVGFNGVNYFFAIREIVSASDCRSVPFAVGVIHCRKQ